MRKKAFLLAAGSAKRWNGISSIRRALTNLSNTGQIVKTGTVQGQYRRPINTYRYGVISHV
jgi:hypothetical protein